MRVDQFSPPANIDDFTTDDQRSGWSDVINQMFESTVASVKNNIAHGDTPQYYNPHTTDGDGQTAVIQWAGFPKVIANKFPGNKPAAWKAAETLDPRGFRPQDEYLEWHAFKNAAGKIIRVSFTCEGPEYWNFLAQTDRSKVLALYQKLVSADVVEADLFPDDQYDPSNKWNTADGAVHLTHPSNSLSAEIQIGGDATVLRAKNGELITDADELINCGQFGVPGRASDPHIGDVVNQQARAGSLLTLKDPIGLYIVEADTTGWKKPDGTPVGDYWTVVRGQAGRALHMVYEVPAAEGFVVGDITINGRHIQFGGQIAEFMFIGLTAVVGPAGAVANHPIGCVPAQPQGIVGTTFSGRRF